MLPDATLPVPASLASLLAVFGPLFTAPSFRTFCGLACGFLSQAGKRTVCGMLAGAGLSRIWPHDRAHRFFARARWNADDLGLAVARLVVALLVPAGEPVVVAIDDTLFRRRGKKVWAASWFHDGSAPGPAKTGYGNNWVIAAIVVKLPACPPARGHPGAGQAGHQGHELRLPAVAGPPHGTDDRRRAARPPHPRRGRFRLRRGRAEEAAGRRDLDHPAAQGRRPARAAAGAHRPARPARTKGDRLPCLAKLAATTAFTQVTVTRYGKTAAVHAAAVTCLWPTVFGARQVTVVLIRDRSAAGYDLALVTTDTAATAAQVIERYASRWSIEVAIEDARQVFGAGQARNRTARAVERTVPFQLACQAIATCWYATAGHDPADVAEHRARAPWYASKAQPSTADMAAKLRRVIIAARFKASRPDQPTPEEISVLRLAWEDLAA